MFGQSPRHLGNYDSDSPESDIDKAERSQLVFCFFPILVGKEWREAPQAAPWRSRATPATS